MKTETILDYVLGQLAANKGRLTEVAKITGVPYSTVSKISQRSTPNPGINHVQKLYDYFKSAA